MSTDDSYRESLIARLKKPEYAAGYIESILADNTNAGFVDRLLRAL